MRLGLAYFVASMTCLAASNMLLKMRAATLGPDRATLLFILVSAGLFLLGLAHNSSQALRAFGRQPLPYLAYGLFAFLGQRFWIAALVMLPLGTATALFYLRSLMLGVFSLREGGARTCRFWMGLSLSLGGVVVTASPSVTTSRIGCLLAIGAAVCSTLARLSLRTSGQHAEPQLVLPIMTLCAGLAGAAATVLRDGELVLHWDSGVVLAAILSGASLAALLTAYRRLPLQVEAASDNLNVVIAVGCGALVLGEGLTVEAVFGSLLIVAAPFVALKPRDQSARIYLNRS